jgi:molybdopterin molybdotransferase
MKPGKPLWFGVSQSTLVFGLPGNPVSSFVCFELFVKPALARLAGRDDEVEGCTVTAQLAADFSHRGDRPTYQPAVLAGRQRAGGMGAPQPESLASRTVTPLPWAGSADLRGLADANALIAFPAGDRSYGAGEDVQVLLLDE